LETEFFLSKTDLQIIEYSWSRLWKTVLSTNKLIDNEEDFRRSLADQIIKTKKSKGFSFGGQTNFLVGRTEQEGESKQRLKDLSKFTMELSQAVHQECAKCLAFLG
jgi:hypothetical protein